MVLCPHTESVAERGLESGLLDPDHLLVTSEARSNGPASLKASALSPWPSDLQLVSQRSEPLQKQVPVAA